MRKLVTLLVIASLAIALVATSAFGATTGVSWHVGTKKTVTIKKNGTVKWKWTDGQPHNVKGPGFRSKTKSAKGTTYSHTFRKKGTFKIICEVHPTTMKTVVKVS